MTRNRRLSLFILSITFLYGGYSYPHQRKNTHSSSRRPSPAVQQKLNVQRAQTREAIRKHFYQKKKQALQTKKNTPHSNNSQTTSLLRWPVHPKNFWLSSYYGPRTIKGKKGFHKGIDMAAPTGTHVVAAASGIIKEAKYSKGYGYYILLDHGNGYKTRYAHLSRIIAKVGQRVKAGQLIGKVGATGNVSKRKSSKSASHLHFEVYKNNKHVNPSVYLPRHQTS